MNMIVIGRKAAFAAVSFSTFLFWSPKLFAQVDASAVDERPVLTLADAVAQALEKDERMIDTRDSLEQARLSVNLARSAFSPKVVPNIYGSFGQSDLANQTYKVDFTQRFTTGTEVRASVGTTSSKNQLGNFYTADTMLLVSQPLLRGFGRGNARRNLDSSEARV